MNPNRGRKSATTPQSNGQQNSGAARSNPIQNVGRNNGAAGQSTTNGARGPQQNFIRGHLLNGQLGGPGNADNLVAGTRSANGQQMSHTEAHLQRQLSQNNGQPINYQVNIGNANGATRQRTNAIQGPGNGFGDLKNIGRNGYGAKKE